MLSRQRPTASRCSNHKIRHRQRRSEIPDLVTIHERLERFDWINLDHPCGAAKSPDMSGDSSANPAIPKKCNRLSGHQHVGEVQNRLNGALPSSVSVVKQMLT